MSTSTSTNLMESGMQTSAVAAPVATAAPKRSTPPAEPIAHAEPTEGGSYTRDTTTGELIKATPPATEVPKQE